MLAFKVPSTGSQGDLQKPMINEDARQLKSIKQPQEEEENGNMIMKRRQQRWVRRVLNGKGITFSRCREVLVLSINTFYSTFLFLIYP